jgi:hypothetical protein
VSNGTVSNFTNSSSALVDKIVNYAQMHVESGAACSLLEGVTGVSGETCTEATKLVKKAFENKAEIKEAYTDVFCYMFPGRCKDYKKNMRE